MIRYVMLLLLSIIVSSETFSQTTLQQRIAEADDLFVSHDNRPQMHLVPDDNAIAREPPEGNIRFVATRRVNLDGLIRGYSPGKKADGRPYWISEQMMRFGMFDGEIVYLENGRIYNIKANVIGWIGNILNQDGTRIGSARFEIYDNEDVHGHLYMPGRVRLEIDPIEGTDNHDVKELHLSTTEHVIDSGRTRTPEERAAAKEEWRQRLADPKYDALRQERDELLKKVLEAEKAKSKE